LLRYKSLEWWKAVRWEPEELRPEELPFNEESRQSIEGVGEAFRSPYPTRYSFIVDLKPRCTKILQYMYANGEFPVPVFLVCDHDIYDIADGSHRLAVYSLMLADTDLRQRLRSKQPCWVAYPLPIGSNA
jgi:hypothetical protein